MKARLETLLREYGTVAVVVFLSLFALTFAGFVVALRLGVHVQSAAGKAGLFGAAYLATEVTKPLRILATLALTPIVARGWRRLRPPPPPEVAPAAPEADPAQKDAAETPGNP